MIWIGYLMLSLWALFWGASVAMAFTRQGWSAWHYALRSIPFWVVVLIRYPAAVLAVLFFVREARLASPFLWLDTIDNTLDGDAGHQAEHMIGADPTAWYNRLLWLWRNGGNRFNYWTIGVEDGNAPAWAFWNKVTVPLVLSRFLDWRCGWSPEGPKQGRRKFVMTLRIKTKP